MPNATCPCRRHVPLWAPLLDLPTLCLPHQARSCSTYSWQVAWLQLVRAHQPRQLPRLLTGGWVRARKPTGWVMAGDGGWVALCRSLPRGGVAAACKPLQPGRVSSNCNAYNVANCAKAAHAGPRDHGAKPCGTACPVGNTWRPLYSTCVTVSLRGGTARGVPVRRRMTVNAACSGASGVPA